MYLHRTVAYLTATAAVGVLSSAPARADLITNGSFEVGAFVSDGNAT
jgi:hypothetical protein